MNNTAQEVPAAAPTPALSVEATALGRQDTTRLIPDLLYPFPVLGTIKLGEMIELENGRRQPVKNPYFSVVSHLKYRSDDGQGYSPTWIPHPLEEELLKNDKLTHKIQNEKRLKDIPIKLMFNDPGLTLRERYEAYDRTNERLACASCGNGNARTYGHDGIKEVKCLGPRDCEFGRQNHCRPRGRLNVEIEGQDDPFSSFLLRTSGINSIRTLRSKLTSYFESFNGKIAHMPLNLHIRARLTSKGVMYYADLVLREGQTLFDAIKKAREAQQEEVDNEFNRVAYEASVHRLLSNGAFEDSEEESLQLEDWEGTGSDTDEEQLRQFGSITPASADSSTSSGSSTSSPGAGEMPQGLAALGVFLNAAGPDGAVTPQAAEALPA